MENLTDADANIGVELIFQSRNGVGIGIGAGIGASGGTSMGAGGRTAPGAILFYSNKRGAKSNEKNVQIVRHAP